MEGFDIDWLVTKNRTVALNLCPIEEKQFESLSPPRIKTLPPFSEIHNVIRKSDFDEGSIYCEIDRYAEEHEI